MFTLVTLAEPWQVLGLEACFSGRVDRGLTSNMSKRRLGMMA